MSQLVAGSIITGGHTNTYGNFVPSAGTLGNRLFFVVISMEEAAYTVAAASIGSIEMRGQTATLVDNAFTSPTTARGIQLFVFNETQVAAILAGSGNMTFDGGSATLPSGNEPAIACFTMEDCNQTLATSYKIEGYNTADAPIEPLPHEITVEGAVTGDLVVFVAHLSQVDTNTWNNADEILDINYPTYAISFATHDVLSDGNITAGISPDGGVAYHTNIIGLSLSAPAGAPNADPVLDTPQDDVVIQEGETGTITADFSDADLDTLTYSISPDITLVTGFGFSTANGSITYDGSQVEATAVSYTITADDGQGGTPATDTFTITVIEATSTITSVSNTVAGGTITVNTGGETDLTTATINSLVYAGLTLADVTVIDADTLTATLPLDGFDLLAANDLVLTADSLVSPAYSLQLTPKLGQAIALTVDYANLHPDSPLAGVAAYSALVAGDILEAELTTSDINTGSYAVVLSGDGQITLTGADTDPDDQLVIFALHDVSDTYNRSNESIWTARAPSYIDTEAPVITILGDNPATHAHGTAYTDAGATALDNVDGNITGDITSTSTVDSDTIGTYYVSYDVIDAAGNEATTAIRTVNVTDQTAPVITLNGDAVVSVEQGRAYTELGATWTDAVDGSGNAAAGGDTVDTSTIGAYTVTYNKTDSAGNIATQVTRTVNVTADVTAPTIGRTGSPVVYVLQNELYTELGATWNDLVDGTGSATVGGDTVNTSVLGSYTVTYDHTDVAGNVADTVTRVVNVVEELPALGGIIVLRDILQPVTRNIIKSIFED